MYERSNEITIHVTLPSGEQTKVVHVHEVRMIYDEDNAYRIVQLNS